MSVVIVIVNRALIILKACIVVLGFVYLSPEALVSLVGGIREEKRSASQ